MPRSTRISASRASLPVHTLFALSLVASSCSEHAPPGGATDLGAPVDLGTGVDQGEEADLAGVGGDAAIPEDGSLGAPGDVTRTLAAYPSRLYDVHVPSGYDGVTPLPVLINLHGGGGNREQGRKTTCAGGDLSSASCLEARADARGFIVVTPDGTGLPVLPNLRTWNAGGGSNGWQCVSGYACNQQIDEAAYFTALLADLKLVVRYRADRVYATGFSNGAALAHRLACELPALIAGIAPVSGGNQYATTMTCSAARAVVEIHGTMDPCWPYAGGAMSCADTNPGSKVSISTTLSDWLTRNGCATTPTDTSLPDTAADGTTTVRHAYACTPGHDVVFYEVTGGGHTWPSGYSFGSNGAIATDFSANDVILDFFAALP